MERYLIHRVVSYISRKPVWALDKSLIISIELCRIALPLN